jgi:hypothetical protein
MRKTLFPVLIALAFIFPSCATFYPNVTSANVNQTQVVLESNNFKVIKRVEGSAAATYIFGIGGLSKKGLVASARTELYNNASLQGSQAIIGEHTEYKTSNIIPYLWGRAIATTSGYVIEFTGEKK